MDLDEARGIARYIAKHPPVDDGSIESRKAQATIALHAELERLRVVARDVTASASPRSADGQRQSVSALALYELDNLVNHDGRFALHGDAGGEASGVLWMAMRYALGRATYAPYEVRQALVEHAHRLPASSRTRMAGEIQWAIDHSRAGMDCDVQVWHDVLAVLADPPS